MFRLRRFWFVVTNWFMVVVVFLRVVRVLVGCMLVF